MRQMQTLLAVLYVQMNEKQCQNPGVFKFTWPGRDEAYICASCVEKLKAVVSAIGLHLQIRPVPEAQLWLPQEQQWRCEQILETEIKR